MLAEIATLTFAHLADFIDIDQFSQTHGPDSLSGGFVVGDSLSLVCRNSIGVLPTLQYSTRNIFGNYSEIVPEPVFLLLGNWQAWSISDCIWARRASSRVDSEAESTAAEISSDRETTQETIASSVTACDPQQ